MSDLKELSNIDLYSYCLNSAYDQRWADYIQELNRRKDNELIRSLLINLVHEKEITNSQLVEVGLSLKEGC